MVGMDAPTNFLNPSNENEETLREVERKTGREQAVK